MSDNTIVIIGSGLAGYSVVKEFRTLDKETPIVMITADQGDYYSKPQLSTALTMGKRAEQLNMGTAVDMADKFNIEIKTQTKIIGIDRDKQVVIGDDFHQPYAKLVLALGADKLTAPLTGDGVDDVQSVNTLEEYDAFRAWLGDKKSIAIIGAGLVACEFANDLANVGVRVTMIAPDHYPLQRFVPEQTGRVLESALTDKGVTWHLCRFATEVHRVDNGFNIVLDNMESITVDGVFSATGLVPKTQLACTAELKVERGIVVNAELQTSDPNIYALGDCAEVNGYVLQHIAPLLACARALAKTLSGISTEVTYPAMPIIVKTPACPMSCYPPVDAQQGVWQFSGVAPDLEGQFIDSGGNLAGFALSGNTLRKRAEFMKQLPDLF